MRIGRIVGIVAPKCGRVMPKCVSDFLAVTANGRILERGARKCVSDVSAARAKDRILDRGVRKCISDFLAVPAKGRILDRGARKWLPEGAATEVPVATLAPASRTRRGVPDPRPRAEEPG